jgi:hypothetical protein
MRFSQGNQPIEALSANGPDHSFAKIALAIGLRGGDFNTFTPSSIIDSSRCLAKILSRSCNK